MPKQIGTYRAKGKMQGRSYYTVKDGVGDIFRSINPAMSERVKTAPEFLNTRKYAEEFGVATGMSQEVCNVIRDSTYTMVSPITRSKLTSYLLSVVKQDTSHRLGQRSLNDYDWQQHVRSMIGSTSRNSVEDMYITDMHCDAEIRMIDNIPRSYLTISFKTNQTHVEKLKRLGVSSFTVTGYFCKLYSKKYSPSAGRYIPTTRIYAVAIDNNYIVVEQETDELYDFGSIADTKEHPNDCTFLFLNIMPHKVIGTESVDIPSLAAWAAIPVIDTSLTEDKKHPLN